MNVRMSLTEGAGVIMAWPALCAHAFGHYAREGVTVELVVLSENDATARLASGDVPLARRGADPHLEAIDAGLPAKIVAGLCAKPPLHLYACPDMRTIGDLRGEPLAGAPGASASSVFLRMVLADGGLAEADCVFRDVGRAANRFGALRTGEVMAGLLSPPASGRAAAERFSHLCSLPAAYPRLPYTVLEANTAFASAEPATLEALLRAEIRALRWLTDPANRTAAVGELARVATLDAADAADCYLEMVERDAVYAVDGAIDADDLARLIDALRRHGGIPPAQPPEAYLDLGFLAAARQAVG